MQVSELKPRGQVDEVTVKVLKLLQDRKVKAKFTGRELWLQEFRVKDDSGEATLVLWEEDCGKIIPQDVVKVTNGYCMPDNNTTKITPGKYGRLEVL